MAKSQASRESLLPKRGKSSDNSVKNDRNAQSKTVFTETVWRQAVEALEGREKIFRSGVI
jgi:hypothetical protein